MESTPAEPLTGRPQKIPKDAKRPDAPKVPEDTKLPEGAKLSEGTKLPEGTKSGAFASLRRLTPFIRPYRGQMILMTLAALGATLVGVAVPLLTKDLIDGPIAHHDKAALWPLGGLVLLFGIAEAMLFWLRRWFLQRAALGIEADIRNAFFRHLQRLPVAFHDSWQSGQLVSRMSGDINSLRRFFGFALIFLVVNGATFLLVGGALVLIHTLMGLIVYAASVPLICTAGSPTAATAGSPAPPRTRRATWPPWSRSRRSASARSRRSAGPASVRPLRRARASCAAGAGEDQDAVRDLGAVRDAAAAGALAVRARRRLRRCPTARCPWAPWSPSSRST